ncbi:rnapii degradation factor def1 [Apiospora phragmitis]|uniref:RNA polymerase II degradation factor 1 n=1 Tax=Apiospora phragmitis TaxID=2905665 RepID=A0ABR1VD64_9PEZI
MSEVQARSQAPTSRGRGGGRGGRGGFGGRGGARKPNGDKSISADSTSFDDDGDVSQLRKQHGEKLDMIKAIFPDWSDADILYALKETDGDVELTATRISEGTISQWGEVSKTKKAPKPKTKESATAGLTESTGNARPIRGGRADGGRGGRGARGNERAGGGRGRATTAHVATNGQRNKDGQLSVPTDEASGWGNTTSTDDATTNANEWGTTGWGTTTTDTTANTTTTFTTDSTTPAPTSTTTSAPAAAPAAMTWASMLRKSTAPAPAPAKPKETEAPKPATDSLEPLPPSEPTEPEPEAPTEEAHEEPTPKVEQAAPVVEPDVALPPPEDDLTRCNLEQLPDESNPPATHTVASTAADSWDPRHGQNSATATPISASQAQHQQSRPTASGYAATALKATERPVRVPSFQRRVLEQEEAVRMPGNREVDRAAVQFGAFSLNGAEDDIDGDREEAETRAQPPSDSPVQPRAALPPVTQPAAVPEAFPSAPGPKPTASLPQPSGAAGIVPFHLLPTQLLYTNISSPAMPVAPPTGPAAAAAAQPPLAPAANQFGRFGHANTHDQSAFPPKQPFDSLGQPPVTTAPGVYDSAYTPASQAPTQPSAAGAFSSAPNDYSSYYTADQYGRGSYNNYYGQHNQHQGAQGHNEGPSSQGRPFAGYNATAQSADNLSQYPQSAAQQLRYGTAAAGDAHNSGHNTPNPATVQAQPQQPQQAGQNNGPQSNLHQQPPANSYPYGHPYYSSPFYAQYMNSTYGGGYGQGAYGAGPYGKGNVYGNPSHYGMSHGGPYDSSPATSGFGQSSLGGRDSGLGSTIDSYGRAGSAQSAAQGMGNSGFGGAHDAFGRAGSTYQSQGGQSYNGPGAQAGSVNDDLKPYGEAKVAGGPSPSLAAAARPGSATNNTPGQSGLPPPQSGAQGMGGYGGYPSHLGGGHNVHSNQTGGSGYGLGGAGGQGHGNNPYGGYGGYGGFGAYGRSQGQQGWGNNY